MAKGLLISAELRALSIIFLVTIGLTVASRKLREVWRTTREKKGIAE